MILTKYLQAISYARYRSEVSKLNISFVKLGEDECEDCSIHEQHIMDCHYGCIPLQNGTCSTCLTHE